MTEYRKLHIPKYPEIGEKAGEETRFWKKFQAPILIKEYGSVSAIHFSPAAPHDFAIASSARVQVYSSKTNSPKKTISRFKDIAHSVSFRNDGQLLVAGDATGLVQVFDVNSRAILRTFREHTLPVHVTQFASDKTHILTASDDRTVRLWDIPAGGSVNVLEGHEDYVRAGVVSNDNPNLLLTGSYDQTVRLWDARQNHCVMTMHHDAPVESVLMYPGGGAVISAGGPMIKVWDLLSGGRCMHVASNHQKTVTSMCFDESASRLVTGSLDHHVKIYNVQDYKVVYNIKYTAPVMSVGLSPNNTHLVAGMANGLLAIRQRPLTAEEKSAKKQKQMMNSSKYKAFLRGQTTVATDEDFVVEVKRRKKLAAYDKYLKKYEHHNALDAVLRNPQPPTVIAMIIELRVRHALVSALSGRDDVGLEPMVQFILKWIHHPRYTNILVEVTDLILDIYSPVLGQSPLIDDLLRNLANKVEQEIALQKDIIQTKAALEMLFASAGTNALANDLE